MAVAEQWFENRLAWQRRLAGASSVRAAGPAFEADVVALLAEADAYWPAAYRAAVLKNRTLTPRRLVVLHAAASPRQRARRVDELGSPARQFECAACLGRARSAHTAAPAGRG
ncbi:MAG TPA: hypothetical protein PL143_02985 [Rhodocyclaceae bacterium]|nr:hypothetical protein [Rhodocyclaceae bacterium]